jgi:energy-coupling factor transporter ATP-binding protein EcfA2
VFGLLGPNGAGKTTVVRILTTIIRPDGGRASVLGYDVVREAGAVRSRIGLAGQYAAVDGNLTGRENLRLIGRLTHIPGRENAPRAAELLVRFGLADAADRLVRTYSGGMRRRLDLAAALVHRPEVVFLDEPTTGLDPQGRLAMWAVIREIVADGTTVLLTTQYLEEADRQPAGWSSSTAEDHRGGHPPASRRRSHHRRATLANRVAQARCCWRSRSSRGQFGDSRQRWNACARQLCSLEEAGLSLNNRRAGAQPRRCLPH